MASVFRRHRGFAVASTLSIAVGMSLATAVFSALDAVLLRPLPFKESNQLVVIYVPFGSGPSGRFSLTTSLARSATAFSSMAAYVSHSMIVGRSGEAHSLSVASVSPSFFSVVGRSADVGSTVEFGAGGSVDKAVLISHSLWFSQFGGDPAVIGKGITVGSEQRTIVGVMPTGFDFPNRVNLWIPMTIDAAAKGVAPYFILGRLASGNTVQSAQAEVLLTYRRLLADVSSRGSDPPHVSTLRDYLTGSMRDQLQLWVAVAIIVLILCGVNFATMSFARGMARGHELALRRALGASATRVILESIVESAALAIVGGALALGLALWFVRFANHFLASSIMSLTVGVNWQTAVFALLATMVMGVLFACIPAIDSARVDIRSVLQSGTGGSTTHRRQLRGRNALVGLQVSLALTATAVVMALIVADRRYQRSAIGIDYSRLLKANVFGIDTAGGPVSLQPLTDNIAGLGGIEFAAAYNGCTETLAALYETSTTLDAPAVACHVSRAFFAVLGLRPVAGRLPTADEVSAHASVVVLSRSLATHLFGSPSVATGRRMRLGADSRDPGGLTVVGVVDDIGDGLFGFTPSVMRVEDLAMRQSAVLLIRAKTTPRLVVRSLSNSLRAADDRVTVSDVSTAMESVEHDRLETRGRTYFLIGVAALAITLAAVGVFGLVAYSTALRAREIGIRMALGAAPARMIWLIVGGLRWSVVAGLCFGLLATVEATAWLDSMFRPGYMTARLIATPVAAICASMVSLLAIMAVGAGVPLRRMLRMDVARSIGGS